MQAVLPVAMLSSGIVWASSKSGARTILSVLKAQDAIWVENGRRYALAAPYALSQEAHKSNKNTWRSAIVAITNTAADSAAVKARLADLQTIAADFAPREFRASGSLPGKWDAAAMIEFGESLTYDQRRLLFDRFNRQLRGLAGAPDLPKMLRELGDPDYRKVSPGSMLSLLKIDIDRLEAGLEDDTLKASDFGVERHLSYDTFIPGEIVAHFRQPVPLSMAAPELLSALAAARPRTSPVWGLGAPPPRDVSLQTLTPEVIQAVNDVQGLRTPPAVGRLLVAIVTGQWRKLDGRSSGAASAFIDNLLNGETAAAFAAQVDHAAMLSEFKAGTLQIHHLKGYDAWFGLRDLPGGRKELVGIVSHEPALPGLLHLLLPKAQAEGATDLACFAVRNDKKATGVLPAYFERQGWKESKRQKLDIELLGATPTERQKKFEQLKAFWRNQGWNEARHGLPDIVHMTYEQRGDSKRSHSQTDESSSVSRRSRAAAGYSVAKRKIGGAGLLAAKASDGFSGDREAGTDDPGAGGSSGGHREVLPGGIDTFESDLKTATPAQLKILGLTPELRDEILPRLGELRAAMR